MKKKSGNIKDRIAYNGKAKRDWISKEDNAYLIFLNKSIMLTNTIDAYENRDVASLDVPNAFIQMHMSVKINGKRVIIEFRGKLVQLLVDIYPIAYQSFVVIKKKYRSYTLKYSSSSL